MARRSHDLAVQRPDDPHPVHPITGEPAPIADRAEAGRAIAFLPHQCDDWVIGQGPAEDVIEALQRLAREVEAAIVYLTTGPHP
jgi:hypothetical protein